MSKEGEEIKAPVASCNSYVEPYISWENGVPKRKYKVVVSKEDILEAKKYAAIQPYQGDWDPINERYIPDPRYSGLSKIEVAQHKLMDAAAAGDLNALAQVENRLVGMPTQSINSFSIKGSLEDFLKTVVDKEESVNMAPAIDIEIEPVHPDHSAGSVSEVPCDMDI